MIKAGFTSMLNLLQRVNESPVRFLLDKWADGAVTERTGIRPVSSLIGAVGNVTSFVSAGKGC